jgi:hypothetical protein
MGERRGIYSFFWVYLGERNNLGDTGVDGRIIIRCIFRKWYVGIWTGSSWFRIGAGGMHF